MSQSIFHFNIPKNVQKYCFFLTYANNSFFFYEKNAFCHEKVAIRTEKTQNKFAYIRKKLYFCRLFWQKSAKMERFLLRINTMNRMNSMKRIILSLVAAVMAVGMQAIPPKTPELGRGHVSVESLDGVLPVRKYVDQQRERRLRANTEGQMVNGMKDGIGNRNMAEHGLVLLVDFTDKSFQSNNKLADFDSLMNAVNYTYNGAYGSVRRYFQDQSNGQYNPHFDVVGPIHLPHTVAYYGTNATSGPAKGSDRYLADFVIDACMAADSLFDVDFTQYDNDGDGNVDFIYIIYAGYGEADGGGATTIWPHNFSLVSALYYGLTNQEEYYVNSGSDYNLPLFDGLYVDNYACSMEMKYSYYDPKRTGIGCVAHEFGHVLGLPDLYDTSYGTNYSNGYTPSDWDIMDGGSYNNDMNTPPNYSVYEKYYLGWVEPELLAGYVTNEGDTVREYSRTLPVDGQTYAMLTRNCQPSLKKSERTDTVYYLENRQQSGWDEYIPGHGMLVWRVMYNDDAWYSNEPNNTDNKPRCTIICAKTGGLGVSSSWGGRQDVPFPGSSNVTYYRPFGLLAPQLKQIQETNQTVSFTFSAAFVPEQPEVETWLICNNWGKGDWVWQTMEPNHDSTEYCYTGIFGTRGVYVNTKPNTQNATFYALDHNTEGYIIDGDIATGDSVLFRYVPARKHLYAISLSLPEGLDEVRSEATKAVKVIINGRMYIRRGEDLYSITGVKMEN